MTRSLNRSAALALAVVLLALTLTASCLTLAASGEAVGMRRASPPSAIRRATPSPDQMRMQPFTGRQSPQAVLAARRSIRVASAPLPRYT